MRRAGAGWVLLVAFLARAAAASQMDAPPPPGPPDSALVDADVVVDGTLAPTGIDPALRASIDAALQARDYMRAETLLLEALEAQPRFYKKAHENLHKAKKARIGLLPPN